MTAGVAHFAATASASAGSRHDTTAICITRNFAHVHRTLPSPSPTWLPQDTLVKIAKKLKKNSVAVDIVSFGCETENEEKLNAFHQAVNSNNNSHLVSVPAGPVLSDVLISSPIFQVDRGSLTGQGMKGSGELGLAVT